MPTPSASPKRLNAIASASFTIRKSRSCQNVVRLNPSKATEPSIIATNTTVPAAFLVARDARERPAQRDAPLPQRQWGQPREQTEVDGERLAVREPGRSRPNAAIPTHVIQL